MVDQLPNRVQSTLSTLLLLCLSLAFAPLSLCLSTFFSLTHSRSRQVRSRTKQKTVLINGARMQKSLAVCRTFARNGWRVVLVEERGWGNLAAPRFSNSVSSFHLLPPASGATSKQNEPQLPYVKALDEVALREKVDLFFPCSGAGTTGLDAIAAQVLLEKTRGKVRSIVQTPELVETLHEKDRFIELLQKLEMAAPRSEIVTSVDEAIAKLQSKGYPPSILKCAAELNDVGRSDMTLYPLLDRKTRQKNWQSTRRRLESLSIPICTQTPYILQEFIGDRETAGGEGGKASEWCTHATVVDGKLTAFVCCPSNDMLMTYYPASHTIVGEMALRWTSTFLYRLQKSAASGELPGWNRDNLVGRYAPSTAGITGQFSMDFIYQPATKDGLFKERLVAIECNPRVHTAICLVIAQPTLGDALVPSALSSSPTQIHAGQDLEKDEIEYLSSLSLPVMEPPPGPNFEQPDFAAIAPSWATSRARFYLVRNAIQEAYGNNHPSIPLSWIGHDLPARFMSSIWPLSSPFSQFLMSYIHPSWTVPAPTSHKVFLPGITPTSFTKSPKPSTTYFDLSAPAKWPPLTDPCFAKDDPWPFFAFYHLQWPQLLLWQLVVRQKKWSRINVSTARIFEC